MYVFAINAGSGENILLGVNMENITADTRGPAITDVKITDISDTGNKVTCKDTDETRVVRVQFPSWADPQQDDLFPKWVTNTKCSGT